MQKSLKEIFKLYTETKTNIFKDRSVLSSDYIPDITLHRDEQIHQLAAILAPALKNEKVSNIFIYGTTGTGKTLITKYVTSELQQSGDIKIIYVNCKMKKVSDTEYRLLAEIVRMFGKEVPATGLPTDEIYKMLYACLKEVKKYIIIIFDEIDALVKKIGDDILYNFIRIGQDIPNIKIAIIGISNDVGFIESLDPRVRSSLSEEEIIFPPYNAKQLQDILFQRAELAFKPGVISDGVIQKCAALAAQEHGDARRAIDLLRIAGEIAEREDARTVMLTHIDKAENKLDIDRYTELVRTLPRQSKAVLMAITKLTEKNKNDIQTGDVFSYYEKICKANGMKVLTQRRVSDIIAELDMQGLISTRLVSRGRYGRTREMSITFSQPIFEKIKTTLKNSFTSL
ncbi:MAG: ORC1-type DNA replication protein [Candidatus Aenigmatarchaeota archaeon]